LQKYYVMMRHNLKKGTYMKNYKHVLVAVELLAENDNSLIKHAEFMTKEFKANIILVHAIEHISWYNAYGVGVGFEIEQALIDNANAAMKKLAQKLDIPEDRCIVKSGPAKFIILEEAKKIGADLIVVGSHGRHGIQIILGTTANAVLHGAQCDVFVVRLKE
jgi:universal stress protein A